MMTPAWQVHLGPAVECGHSDLEVLVRILHSLRFSVIVKDSWASDWIEKPRRSMVVWTGCSEDLDGGEGRVVLVLGA